MGGGITVQGNRPRHTTLAFDRLLEEGLSCHYVSLGTEPEIDGLSGPVDGPVKIAPLASNFHVSLVDPPGVARRKAKTIPAFDEFRCVALYPSQNCGVGQRQAALGHDLDQIAQAELVAQVPTHAQDNHFAIKVATSEQLIHAFVPAHIDPS